MTARSSRNGAAPDLPDIPESLSRPAPTFLQLASDPSIADLARAYGTLCTHYHEERLAVIAWMQEICKVVMQIRHGQERRGVVSLGAFVTVCVAAGMAITSTFWLVWTRH